jgi:5'-3' exonuclease
MTEYILIDLSSIAYPIWHMSQNEPNPNHVSQAIVAKVRAIATGKPRVAICIDTGKSFRKAIDATYKANRPESAELAPLHHQIKLAIETLEADKFPVWGAPGFEADDIVATATVALLQRNADDTVRIFSADKDLLQLVGPRCVAQSLRDDKVIDEAAVEQKFGVPPSQLRDLLAIMGDTSDNIIGVKGMGLKKGAEFLKKFQSLDLGLAALQMQPDTFSPAAKAALDEYRPRASKVQALVTLRTDAPITLREIDEERVPDDVAAFTDRAEGGSFAPPAAAPAQDDIDFAMQPLASPAQEAPPAVAGVTSPATGSLTSAASPGPAAPPVLPFVPKAAAPPAPVAASETLPPQQGLQRRPPAPPAVVDGEVMPFEQSLEPRNMMQAVALAQDMFASRLFGNYGTPQAVLATIMAGREFGLQAHASLRGFHIIEGKQTMSADLMRALVIKRKDVCEYFRCKERSATAATFVTKRIGDPDTLELRYTIEEAQAAGLVKAGSGWVKNPADMLVARASSKLARLAYPDILFGVYAPEEFD